jgi:Ca2+-binding EF-hand superfamily protein
LVFNLLLIKEETLNNLKMRFSYETLNVINNNNDGYINATELCKSYYKDFIDYLKEDEWSQLLEKYKKVYKTIQFDSFMSVSKLMYMFILL